MRPLLPLLLLAAPLAAQVPIDSTNQDRANLVFMVQVVRHEIEPAVTAMPATKFGFAPTQGEFTGVRSFAREAKHLSATNTSFHRLHLEFTHPPTPEMRWVP